MKKLISFSGKGRRADIGDMTIYRLLPNRFADAAGPFVFLDHIAPTIVEPPINDKKRGTGPHPHRGIATLTYLLNGQDVHLDSRGNHALVSSGGVQWMKAGNGIIHDEYLTTDPATNDNLTHGFQFWINLPSKNKLEDPQYLAIQAEDVPFRNLSYDTGWMKVIAGKFDDLESIIPEYSTQFIYHLCINAGKQFSFSTKSGLEYAAFLPLKNMRINDAEFDEGEYIEFDRNDGTIELHNNTSDATDILIFGGERYLEPIVAEGPFVMNSRQEIAAAYRDFHAGKYGKIGQL